MSVTTAQNQYLGAMSEADILAIRSIISRGKVLFVNGWDGDDDNDGSTFDQAFATVEHALSVATSGSTIFLTGRVREQIVAPLSLFDISIIGISPGNPRQCTNSGVQAGYSAYWTFATDNTVALLTLREQGWRIENICFAPPASTAVTAAAILAVRAESATYPDPSHLIVKGCYFAGGGNAIIDSGGVGFVTIEDCRFYAQTGFSIQNTAGAGIAAPLCWNIRRNRFLGMTNGVKADFSHAVIEGNVFSDGGTPNTTVVLSTNVSGGGGNNFIVNNFFQTATANFNTPDIVGNATDVWQNISIDGTFTSGGINGNESGQPA